MLINGLRGHLAEFGIIVAKGPGGMKAATEALHEAQDRLELTRIDGRFRAWVTQRRWISFHSRLGTGSRERNGAVAGCTSPR